MNQTKLGSLIEVLVNIAIGFTISWVANMVIMPLYGCAISAWDAFTMGWYFTVISVARGYIVRRWFNARLHSWSQRMAGGAA